jgi:hypothetical protein
MTSVCAGKQFEALMQIEDLFGSLKNSVEDLKIPLPEDWPDDSTLDEDFLSALKSLLENENFWKTIATECNEGNLQHIISIKNNIIDSLPIARSVR